ncbi:energy-coupled thiamine transporter ThiT [Streptococcus sp. zg-JUN1979]|uniref:energy-coupled thiamine transporter ThiT n=1 Tax=Streptococcus sp. zg-JUN1979 TaxID=3391450 RepID=UPI0039A4DA03
MSKSSNRTALVEAALFAALAMVLSLIPDFASWFTPSFGAIALIFISLRRGLKYGLISGFIWGLLHFVLGKAYILTPYQAFIEYIFAFTVMGLAGLFSGRIQVYLKEKQRTKVLLTAYLAAFIACFVRYLLHFYAGVLFWGSYAPKGVGAVAYSISVNGTTGLLTWSITVISLTIIILSSPKLLEVN